jgi:hypothetical protein
MSAQKHIDAIGRAQVRCEEASREVRQAARKLDKALADLHKELDAAQVAYAKANPRGNVVAFSGGTNKPPRPPVDEPLDPIPGP